MADTHKLIDFLTLRSPFHENTLCSIVSADPTVNVECVKEVGNNILKNMFGNSIAEHSFKKKEQVVTLINNSS